MVKKKSTGKISKTGEIQKRRNINLSETLYKKAQKISGLNNASAGIRLALKEYKK